jgi:hypothetical protein
MEFVAAIMGQRESAFAFADAGQLGRKIGQLLRDEMNNITSPSAEN